MHKLLSTILAAAFTVLTVTSCSLPGTGKGTDATDDDSGSKYGKPSHDLSTVDVTKTLPYYYLDDYDEPWGSKYELRMAKGNVENFFCYYSFDEQGYIVNENLNDVSTVTRPRVRAFPAEEEGYVMYEITYTQTFPVRSKEPEYVNDSMYYYYDLKFVDYYTGTVFPWINIFEENQSFCLFQDFWYQGEKYHLGYYEFHEQVTEEEPSEDAGGGLIIRKKMIRCTTTSYLIVPEDYDGILMYVYASDDGIYGGDNGNDDTGDTEYTEDKNSDRDYLNTDPVTVYDPCPFDDEENIDDYIFFGITGSK